MTGGSVRHNITSDMGGPKQLKTFFRINTPHLTYGYTQSFIQAFGVEGKEAVNEAFEIMNDFFSRQNMGSSRKKINFIGSVTLNILVETVSK